MNTTNGRKSNGYITLLFYDITIDISSSVELRVIRGKRFFESCFYLFLHCKHLSLT